MTPEQKKQVVAYRLAKSRETIDEVEILVQNKLWNIAVNRLYYACFYAVNALLANEDIYSKTHSGVRQMFGKYFIVTGKIKLTTGDFYSKIFTFRHRGDYEDFIDFSGNDVLVLIAPAKELISEIENILA